MYPVFCPFQITIFARFAPLLITARLFMSEHYVIRGEKKHCLHCKQTYVKSVSSNTLTKHYNNAHKSQSSILSSTVNAISRIANEQLSSKLAKAFALLNWPLHHVNSKTFGEVVEIIRQSSAKMPHRVTLRTKTLSVAKECQDR
jgi:hypothetical protein